MNGFTTYKKYCKYYSGQEPQFVEGDVFRIIVPLDETYSYDFLQINGTNDISDTTRDTVDTNRYVISDTIRKGYPDHLQALFREYYLLYSLFAFCG